MAKLPTHLVYPSLYDLPFDTVVHLNPEALVVERGTLAVYIDPAYGYSERSYSRFVDLPVRRDLVHGYVVYLPKFVSWLPRVLSESDKQRLIPVDEIVVEGE